MHVSAGTQTRREGLRLNFALLEMTTSLQLMSPTIKKQKNLLNHAYNYIIKISASDFHVVVIYNNKKSKHK